MNLRFLSLLFLCTTLTAQATTESKPDWESLAKQKIELLSNVRDHASANAAAPICKRLDLAMHKTPGTAECTNNFKEKLSKISDKLEKNFFYGSTKLACALDAKEYKAMLPQPVTPQIISELEERARLSFELIPEYARRGISGGPGFSRETAWIHTSKRSAMNPDSTAPTTMPYILTGYGMGIPYKLGERLEHTDNRLYRITTMALFHRGKMHKLDIWEDLTRGIVRFGPKKEPTMLELINDDTVAYLAQIEAKLHVLRGVHDKNSADVAADYLYDLDSGIHNVPYYVTRGLHERTNFHHQYDEETKRLQDAHFYGSTSLADALEYHKHLQTPQALTSEAADEIEQIIRTALAESPHLQKTLITGGPGFTMETAWHFTAEIIDCVHHKPAINNTTYVPFDDLCDNIITPDYRFRRDDVRGGTINGRLYDVWKISVLLNEKLYQYEMWLDMTDGQDIPTEEEYKAAYAANGLQLKETAEILSRVTDTATADAAAKQLMKQKKLWMPKHHPIDSDCGIYSTAPIDDVRKAYIEKRKQEICEENCYDSSALKILLYSKDGNFGAPNLTLTEEEKAARKEMHAQQELQFVRSLAELLPGVTDRASAIAAARTLLSIIDEDAYSPINILQRERITRQIDIQPIREQIKRIRSERFYICYDLAGILTAIDLSNEFSLEDDKEEEEVL